MCVLVLYKTVLRASATGPEGAGHGPRDRKERRLTRIFETGLDFILRSRQNAE